MKQWSPVIARCPGCGRMRAVLRPDGTPTTCVSPLRAPVEGRAIPPARLSTGALTGTSPVRRREVNTPDRSPSRGFAVGGTKGRNR